MTLYKDLHKDKLEFVESHLAKRWQAKRESNPQPAVLETAALPIELLA